MRNTYLKLLTIIVCAGCSQAPVVTPSDDSVEWEQTSPHEQPTSEHDAECGNEALDEAELCDSTAGVPCPTTPADCQIKFGLCFAWAVEGEPCARRCVQGKGICGVVLHPTDSNAFPEQCEVGCPAKDTRSDLANWK